MEWLFDDDATLPVELGQLVGGKYRVDQVLARGGMGIICLGRHVELDQPVAIKFIRAEFLENPACVHRFMDEARAAAALSSAHVVKMFDVGRLENSVPYLVMEQLSGNDLQTLLDRCGPLSVSMAVSTLLDVCEALAEAHAVGIIHRDIKPENIFIASMRDGRSIVKLLDFGIAKLLRGPSAARGLTQPRELIGSPWYMSPEQLRTPDSVDARSDVWSVGVVLHELLSGSPPFAGATPAETCRRVLLDEPPSLTTLRSDVPSGLEDVISRCLQKDRERRFASVRELATALEPFVSFEPDVGIVIDEEPFVDVEAHTVPSFRAPDPDSIRPLMLADEGPTSKRHRRPPKRRGSGLVTATLLGVALGAFASFGLESPSTQRIRALTDGWLTPTPLEPSPVSVDSPVPKEERPWSPSGVVGSTAVDGTELAAERELASAPANTGSHRRVKTTSPAGTEPDAYHTYAEFLRREGLTPLRKVLAELNEAAPSTHQP